MAVTKFTNVTYTELMLVKVGTFLLVSFGFTSSSGSIDNTCGVLRNEVGFFEALGTGDVLDDGLKGISEIEKVSRGS